MRGGPSGPRQEPMLHGRSASRSDQRPSPEALLEAARREEGRTGKLKIFVGAAPGVGKTYEMLQEARACAKSGVDVVVGVVETHGRKETEALVEGLEVIPRRAVDYKGRTLEEMDLDALLARRPKLALVDELAHTNAPGSRHPKRYLDVEELLANGIDVYTTLNIQHIESLNDVVAQITGVRVRETVPDSILDRADNIELVDLTPDDLIQRLKEGKVYVPEQARRALEHYFSPVNLTALRELALRRTAERVDEQLLAEMQARAISGPMAAGERILVCVSEDPRAVDLVRYTKRIADRLHAPWTALWIEGPRSLQLNEEERDRIADTLRLAQRLGGEAVTIPGTRRIADEVLSFAHANNVTHITIGKSSRSRWFELLHGSVVHELVRRAGNISVHVIAGEELAGEAIPKKTVRTADTSAGFDFRPYACRSAGRRHRAWRGHPDPAVSRHREHRSRIPHRRGRGRRALRAVRRRSWPALPPRFATTSSSCRRSTPSPSPTPTNVAAFIFFIAGRRAHLQSRRAGSRASLHGAGAGAHDRTALCLQPQARRRRHPRRPALGHRLPNRIDAEDCASFCCLPENGAIGVKAGYPPEDTLDEADLAAATWAWEHNRAAGRGADTLPGAKRLFLPMRTGRGAIGVVGIDSDKPGPLLTPDQRRLLDALIDQAALASRARASRRGP